MAEGISRHWTLDEDVEFLNHGSFGACPIPVLAAQQEWRRRMEREPVSFFLRDLPGLLDAARSDLAAFLGTQPESVVFVPNATAGVNTVLRSLSFSPGDELLATDHAYRAAANAIEFTAMRSGATLRVVRLPFPLAGPAQVIEPILAAITPRTRLLLVDHVTSPTGFIMPLEEIAKVMQARGIDVLVDGAHAPGMIPLRLAELPVAYYTGNCHKWLCAPKGAGFLHVRPDRQERIRPLAISHAASVVPPGVSRFHAEFDWTGTYDPSAWLAVSESIRFLGTLLPGGWPALMKANHELALAGRKALCAALELPPPTPDSMIGAMASLPLPASTDPLPASPIDLDPFQERLFDEHRIRVPIFPWPAPPHRLVRISAQIYNSLDQFERLGAVLRRHLE